MYETVSHKYTAPKRFFDEMSLFELCQTPCGGVELFPAYHS